MTFRQGGSPIMKSMASFCVSEVTFRYSTFFHICPKCKLTVFWTEVSIRLLVINSDWLLHYLNVILTDFQSEVRNEYSQKIRVIQVKVRRPLCPQDKFFHGQVLCLSGRVISANARLEQTFRGHSYNDIRWAFRQSQYSSDNLLKISLSSFRLLFLCNCAHSGSFGDERVCAECWILHFFWFRHRDICPHPPHHPCYVRFFFFWTCVVT